MSSRVAWQSRAAASLELANRGHEADLARLSLIEDLDAWSAYHLGLQHMYRFSRKANAAAAALFLRAPGAWAANVRERNPALSREDFFRSFPMKVAQARARVSGALEKCGF